MNRQRLTSVILASIVALWGALFVCLLVVMGFDNWGTTGATALTLAGLTALLAVASVFWLTEKRKQRRTTATKLRNADRRDQVISDEVDTLKKTIATLNARLATLDKRLATAEQQASAAKDKASRVQEAVQKVAKTSEAPAPLPGSDADLFMLTNAVQQLAHDADIDLTRIVDVEAAARQTRRAVALQQFLSTVALVRAQPELLTHLTLDECRKLFSNYRNCGYLEASCLVINHIAERWQKPNDIAAALRFQSELEVYQGVGSYHVDLPPLGDEPLAAGVTMHVVGKALPETQSGYTLRTHYTAKAQQQLGLRPVVVAHSGSGAHAHENTETYIHEGIRYYLLGGPQRGAGSWHDWFESNIRKLAEVVVLVRPEVLHAHSDFMNSIIAQHVGRAYGIPVVNETRGFWEESWLSRTATARGWDNIAAIDAQYGLPDMYQLRLQREAELRSSADAVVTLAQVMRKHIVELEQRFDLPHTRVELAPNAVDSAEFPVVARHEATIDRLGLSPDSTIIGYISSIVEYEGIETLIRAVAEIVALVSVSVASKEQLSMAENAPGTARTNCDRQGTESLDNGVGDLASDVSNETAAPVPSQSRIAALRTAITDSSGFLNLTPAAADVDDLEADDDYEKNEAPAGEQVVELATRLRSVHQDATDEQLQQHAAELLKTGLEGDCPHLLIVGDGAELNNLKQLTTNLGLDSHVTFTGRVPHGEVLNYYSVIDLFVVPRKSAAVTELVTPLKPFEAMSTGRPCIFSNVGALAEIAGDSEAAATFVADDHHDLALTMARLLMRPDELARMSRVGAAWVRDERTWYLNAARYLPVYESLGMTVSIPRSTRELLQLNGEGVSAQEIIRHLAAGPLPAPSGWFTLDPKPYTAERIMNDGWGLARLPVIRFTPELDWDAPGRENRSWGFHLHAWEFIDPVLTEYYETGNLELLQWMLTVADHWWDSIEQVDPQETMAWYDMSLSLRMPRLARLMIATAKSSIPAETSRLIRHALANIHMMLQPEAFNGGNNHGFFAAAAGLDYAKWLPMLPKIHELATLSSERMQLMAQSQFGSDGGHLEHSPDYHRMLLGSFERAFSEGLLTDPEVSGRVEKAADVLGWLVQPDGHLVQFGDSPAFDVETNELSSINPNTQFILSDGKTGSADRRELMVLPETGYAVVRSPQPQMVGARIASSYLAFQTAFHSRAHKHADDLTFVWFDRGCELVVDSGRFGYIDLLPANAPDRKLGFYYAAPERQYVESTIAHNTVSVDGVDIERRARQPHGSGLGKCEHLDGRFVLRGRVDHGRYVHERTLELTPGEQLVVTDHLIPAADAELQEAVAWFNLDGSLKLQHGDALEFTLPNGTADQLVVTSTAQLITPVRGQEQPLRGWRSRVDRALEPTYNFGFKVSLHEATTIVTTFALLN